MENKDKKPIRSQHPKVDLETLIQESLETAPPNSPAVWAAEEYFRLLAKPFSYFEQQ